MHAQPLTFSYYTYKVHSKCKQQKSEQQYLQKHDLYWRCSGRRSSIFNLLCNWNISISSCSSWQLSQPNLALLLAKMVGEGSNSLTLQHSSTGKELKIQIPSSNTTHEAYSSMLDEQVCLKIRPK